MKVSELIIALSKFPPKTMVVVEGYETGFDGIHQLLEIIMAPHNPSANDWDGEYAQAKTDSHSETAVCILGRRGHRR